jgi:Ni/Fe-hydrogenase subunit HybB-like protein
MTSKDPSNAAVPDEPILAPGHDAASITDKISSLVLARGATRGWYLGAAVALALVMLLLVSLAYLLMRGIGVWGLNNQIAWGFAIINFVWWIGIGHAGTLISAILLLLKQQWRTSINRFAEAMTIFAVMCAGIFPLIHLGRPWLAHWLLPYPNTMGLWPQFRSPLVWDVFAVSTYATVSALFWYVGLVPDLATLRDRATRRIPRAFYAFFSMGWRGATHHWDRYETAYLLLAGLATPLVISVHSVIAFDFAVSVLPGWHTTIMPPYFVAGAVFSGFAMVLTIAIPVRAVYGLQDFITMRHLDNMAKVMLGTGMIVAYGYLTEIFIAWYGSNGFEEFMVKNRMVGPYAPAYWSLILCNILVPQLLWSPAVRRNTRLLLAIALIVNIGMWLERFIIVVTSLHRDFLPANWDMYVPTFWDWATYAGTIGLFVLLLFLFMRFMPVISIFEMRTLVEPADHEDSTSTGEAKP